MIHKAKYYYITAIFSIIFTFVGFSYNAWRLEISEDNNNIRIASFQVLQELANLELLVYTAHYDQDVINGSPRKGWVKVNLINDLSYLTPVDVRIETNVLKSVWQTQWESMSSNNDAAMKIVNAIDKVRRQVVIQLQKLD